MNPWEKELEMFKILFTLAVFLLLAASGFAQCVDTAWVRTYNGPGNEDDKAFAMMVDALGNVYVTGQSYQSGGRDDYVTIKYCPNGDTAWIRTYDGPISYHDQARAVAVDHSGNVLVTGLSWGDGTSEDYATIKYNSNGDVAWVERYHGEGDWADLALALAVDASGNAYVTGWSWGSGTCEDYLTIKYLPNGDTAWVRRYNGPGDSTDIAYAVAVDASGNAYVTGTSYGSATGLDYATVKYASDGTESWIRRYDGPAGQEDQALVLTLDSDGNVLISGRSTGVGTGLDYATIKYDPPGNELWVERYDALQLDDAASAIVSDAWGNVYVTGTSKSNDTYYDYATLKYYPDGSQAWVRRYSGIGPGWDFPHDMAVDDSGSVFVTGYSFGSARAATVKYDREGNICWAERYPAEAHAVAVDSSGNLYVGAVTLFQETSWDFLTIKYSPAQIAAQPGDANGDGLIDVADVVSMVSYLYRLGGPPCPWESGDPNCDGMINVGDVVYLINYLYRGGPPPCT
jgi:uncharacterized delta-60 repeat protein